MMKFIILLNSILFSCYSFAVGVTSADLRNVVVEGTLEYSGSAINGDSVTVYAVVTDPSNQCILWAEAQTMTITGGSLVLPLGGAGTSPSISTNFTTIDQVFNNNIVSTYGSTNCITSYQGMSSSVTTVGQITDITSYSSRNITILFNDTTRSSGVMTLGSIPFYGVPYASYAANAGAIGGNSVSSTAPTSTNQILMWNNSLSNWMPGSITAGTGISLINPSAGTVQISTTAGTVSGGGTGLTSTTAGGVLYGASSSSYGFTAAGVAGQTLISSGSSAPTWGTLGTTYGGTGVNSSAAANGSLLVGNGSGFTLANITPGANMSVVNGAGSITVGLSTTANTALTSVTNATSTNTASTLVLRDASGNFSAGTVTTSGLSSGTVSATSVASATLSASTVTTSTLNSSGSTLAIKSDSGNVIGIQGGGDGSQAIYLNSGGAGPIYLNGTGGLISAVDGKFNGVSVGAASGYFGTRLGYLALQSATTGATYNTGVGYQSLYSMTSGASNTAVGANSLTTVTTGNDNTALGANSLKALLTGSYNTAVGNLSLYQSTGAYNTGLGAGTLGVATSAVGNTAVGYQALGNNNVGSYNVAVGYAAGSALGASVGNTVIIGNHTGSGVTANQVLIADGAGNERLRITSAGNVGIANSNPSYALDVTGDLNVSGCYRYAGISTGYGVCSSDARLKEDIQDYTPGLQALLSVRLRSYKLNGLGGLPKTGQTEIGVIAQELEATHPELIKTRLVLLHPEDKEKTEIKAVDYTKFSYMAINAIKDLYKLWSDDSTAKTRDIASLQQQLDSVQSENAMLKQRLDNLERQLNEK